ncbi:hypothetical protein KIPB_005371, partial [Kipferlia bialata]
DVQDASDAAAMEAEQRVQLEEALVFQEERRGHIEAAAAEEEQMLRDGTDAMQDGTDAMQDGTDAMQDGTDAMQGETAELKAERDELQAELDALEAMHPGLLAKVQASTPRPDSALVRAVKGPYSHTPSTHY